MSKMARVKTVNLWNKKTGNNRKKMRIVGYHISGKVIANSDGEVCIEPPYLDFLLGQKLDAIKVLYHMDYNLADLLGLINLTEAEAGKLQTENRLYISPYTLKYIAGKFFSIKKGRQYDYLLANFSNMSQYKSVRLEENETVEDCLAKAREAQKIGERVYAVLLAVGLHPISLTSPINAYEKEILARMDLPTIDDMPEEAGYYAYQCLHGNWLEAFQLGQWEQVYDYDINSAYPAELAQLLDIRLGKWVKSNQWIAEATYGYCKGVATITAPFSPIIYTSGKSGNSLNYTPTGSWDTYLPKQSIEFIHKWQQGKFELEDGWWWIADKKERPLRNIIEQLYREKEQSSGLEKEVIKRIMSGVWGKFLQVQRDGFGDRFNPVYGTEAETNTRLKVAEFVLQNKVQPIHIAVDGVLTAKPVSLSNGSSKIGRWELTSAAPCICAGTAVVAIQGKEKAADFSLDYDWLMEQIKENPEAKKYSMEKLSPVTLAVALKGNWDKLGQLRKITKTIDIGSDVKRCYRKAPEYGKDLLGKYYDSEPWDISLLSKPA